MISTKRHFFLLVTSPSARPEVDSKGLTNIIHESALYNIFGELQGDYLRVDGIKGDLVRNECSDKLNLIIRGKLLLRAILNRNIYFFSFYAGTWFGQFGHFITETITRINNHVIHSNAKLIFHSLDLDKKNHAMLAYQESAFKLLQINKNRVKILTDQPAVLLFSTALMPTVILNKKVDLAALKVWQNISSATPILATKKRIFISRARIDKSRLKIPHELNEKIEHYFLLRNFEIIHPESLDFIDQVTLVKNANCIAGLMGSGLHLSVFADQVAKIIEIGDKESPGMGNPHQFELTKACRQEHIFISFKPEQKSIDWNLLDSIVGKLSA